MSTIAKLVGDATAVSVPAKSSAEMIAELSEAKRAMVTPDKKARRIAAAEQQLADARALKITPSATDASAATWGSWGKAKP